jgi:hypothetical protein
MTATHTVTDDAYVFLGPTLPVERAQEILPAIYLPPVSVGDVLELVLDRTPPFAIGIVDGLFEQTPAVWHKEILYAISVGTRVFGASSMGALRAAELHTFGMTGVGEIFAAYRDGDCIDDDEVTIVHAAAEDGYRPLSDAMVNLRAGVADAVAHRVIGPVSAEIMLDTAKSMFYADRTWESMCLAARTRGVPTAEASALLRHVRRTRPDAKRADAETMLRRMADVLVGPRTPDRPSVRLEPTYYWDKLCRTVRNERTRDRRRDETPVSAAEEDSSSGGSPAIERDALLRLLLDHEATRIGLLVNGAHYRPGSSDSEEVFRMVARRYRTELGGYLPPTAGSPPQGADHLGDNDKSRRLSGDRH